MGNSIEEKVLAFIREHSGDFQGAKVPLLESVCAAEFGGSASEVQQALFALAGRGVVSFRKPAGNYIPAKAILSGSERAARHRAKMISQGRKQLMLWVTADEEAALRAALEKMRASGGKSA